MGMSAQFVGGLSINDGGLACGTLQFLSSFKQTWHWLMINLEVRLPIQYAALSESSVGVIMGMYQHRWRPG